MNESAPVTLERVGHERKLKPVAHLFWLLQLVVPRRHTSFGHHGARIIGLAHKSSPEASHGVPPVQFYSPVAGKGGQGTSSATSAPQDRSADVQGWDCAKCGRNNPLQRRKCQTWKCREKGPYYEDKLQQVYWDGVAASPTMHRARSAGRAAA